MSVYSGPAAVSTYAIEKFLRRGNGTPPVASGNYVFAGSPDSSTIYRVTVGPEGAATKIHDLVVASGKYDAILNKELVYPRATTVYAFWVAKKAGDKLRPAAVQSALRREAHLVWIQAADIEARRLVVAAYEADDVTVGIEAPGETPETSQYVFSEAKPGVLTIECIARFEPANPELEAKGRWIIDPIGESKLAWSVPDPADATKGKGAVVTATFTGLPAKNEDFGWNRVRFSVEGTGIRRERGIRVFWPRAGRNNPTGKIPNWFYYWNQTGAGNPYAIHYLHEVIQQKIEEDKLRIQSADGITMALVPAMTHWDRWDGGKKTIVFTPFLEWDPNNPDNPETWVKFKLKSPVNGKTMKGIAAFANLVKHETWHTKQIERADAVLPDLMKKSMPASGWPFAKEHDSFFKPEVWLKDWDRDGWPDKLKDDSVKDVVKYGGYLEDEAFHNTEGKAGDYSHEDWASPGSNYA